LSADGNVVDIVCASVSESSVQTNFGNLITLKIADFTFAGPLRTALKKILFNKKVKLFIQKNGKNYDILHIHGDVCGFKELENYNSIATFHGFTSDAAKKRNLFTKLILYIFSGRYEIKNAIHAKTLIAVSKSVANSINKISHKKVEVIYNGVDSSLYKPINQKHKYEMRRKLRMKKNEFYVLFSGVDKYIKGFDILLKSSKLLNDGVQINVLGISGKNKPKIKFLGYLSDNTKMEYIKCSDIFVAPSRYDAFPLATLEAMSCGLPTIISDTVGTKEILKNKYDGIIIKGLNASKYTQTINKLAKNRKLLKRLSLNGRKLALKYDWENVYIKYKQIYDRVVV
jgi:glycosyltransferase involved in cell wall biosynthesis